MSWRRYPSDVYARFINSIYYREFDEDLAKHMIKETKKIEIKKILDSPKLFFDLVMVPYKIELNLENYRVAGLKDGDNGDAEEVIQKISDYGGRIAKIIEDKLQSVE